MRTTTYIQAVNEAIKDELIGSSVVTKYNNRILRVDDIEFNFSVNDTFPKDIKEKGKDLVQVEVSYKQYYWEKYKEKITDESQPALVHIDKKD